MLLPRKFSLACCARQHLARAYDPAGRLLQAHYLAGSRGSQHIQICSASGFQAIIRQAQSARGIIGDKIESGLDLAGSGHMRGMADVADNLLLVVAPERIEWIGHIILRGKNIHAMPPELLDARNAAPYWFLIVASLY